MTELFVYVSCACVVVSVCHVCVHFKCMPLYTPVDMIFIHSNLADVTFAHSFRLAAEQNHNDSTTFLSPFF